jgi:hypothetical protein
MLALIQSLEINGHQSRENSDHKNEKDKDYFDYV